MSFHEVRIMSTLLRRHASNHDGIYVPSTNRGEAHQLRLGLYVCPTYSKFLDNAYYTRYTVITTDGRRRKNASL